MFSERKKFSSKEKERVNQEKIPRSKQKFSNKKKKNKMQIENDSKVSK